MEEKINIQRITFAENNLPVFKENKAKGYINFGEDNNYPSTLIDLYNKSPKHNAIVNQKAAYVGGDRVEILTANTTEKAKAQEALNNINAYEDYSSLNAKISQDLELFNGYALEVIWNKAKTAIAELYHLPFQNIRIGKDKFFYSENWVDRKCEVMEYVPFNPMTRENRQLFYFKMYRAGQGSYPLPDYIGAIRYIEIDTEISNWHLNSIKTGFSAQTLIQLFKGQPTPEEARITQKRFKDNFQGTNNAGSVVLMYNEQNERAAEVTNLQPSDFDKQFLQLNDQVRNEIFIGHRISNPVLFGISTAGALGQRNELIEAYELFQTAYVEPRQNQKDKSFNSVFKYIVDVELKTINKPPIGQDYVYLFEKGIIDKNEARIELGFKPSEVTKMSAQYTEADMLQMFSECGESKELFELAKIEFASAGEIAVLQILNDNPGISVGEIAKYVNLDASKIMDVVTKLINDGAVNSDNGALTIADSGSQILKDNVTTTLEIRYEYALDPAFSGEPEIIPTTRDFCRQLIELNKFYTRDEINTISSRVGEDVWKHRGGWYTVPNTNRHIHHCRHIWQSKLVRRKL